METIKIEENIDERYNYDSANLEYLGEIIFKLVTNKELTFNEITAIQEILEEHAGKPVNKRVG